MKLSIALICLVLAVSGSHAVDKLKLSSGHEIPVVGLGTGSISEEQAITSALENGYRHIDTAFAYENEKQIGEALKKWFAKGNQREDVFITSKLATQGNRPADVEKYLKHSLEDLGVEYVDMYLIHTPFGVKAHSDLSPYLENGDTVFDEVDHVALWKAMEAQVKAGRAKSIGLSNFNRTQVAKVYDKAEIKPSNLQVESHAYLQQKELRKFCKDRNIVMTAYAPLGSKKSREQLHNNTEKELPPLMELPLIKELAEKYKKEPGQILLRHSIQDGLVVIPKSSNPQRQKSNIEVFDFKLTEEEMKRIGELDKGEQGRVYDFLGYYKDLDKQAHYPFRANKA